MIEIPYRASRADNPNWPLPPDYYDLEAGEQLAYRLAVCKTQETPEDFVAAFLFFENYYLVDIEEEGGPPFFDQYIPNAPFQIAGLKDFHRHDFNVLGAPRGYAKSAKFALELPLFLIVTRPYYRIAICFSTDNWVARRMIRVKQQLEQNPRLVNDWGKMKPKRSEGLWSNHQLDLLNGSSVDGFSVKGRKRGERPHLFILDDPEYDPEASTDMKILTDQFAKIMFRQIIPMLRPGCKVFWLGTTINRRSFLYYALAGEDARFLHWNRRRLKAFEITPEGEIQLLWEAMFDYEQLMKRKSQIGPSEFSAEYLNEPVAEEDKIFNIHHLYDTYEIRGSLEPHPYHCDAQIQFFKLPKFGREQSTEDVELVKKPFKDFLKEMPNIIMTADYAPTVSPTSDYSCVAVEGFTPDLNMWILDLWHGKVGDAKLVEIIWKMGCKWLPRVVACEHDSILDLLIIRMAEFTQKWGDQGWRPRPFKLPYMGGRNAPSKSARIGAEEWRFTSHTIKLPWYRRTEPQWRTLFQQIEDFTRDLNLLQYDDAIDTVLGMPRFVIKTPGLAQTPPRERTPEDYLKEGKSTDEYGWPLVTDLDEASSELIQMALDKRHERANNKDRRKKCLHVGRVTPPGRT